MKLETSKQNSKERTEELDLVSCEYCLGVRITHRGPGGVGRPTPRCLSEKGLAVWYHWLALMGDSRSCEIFNFMSFHVLLSAPYVSGTPIMDH